MSPLITKLKIMNGLRRCRNLENMKSRFVSSPDRENKVSSKNYAIQYNAIERTVNNTTKAIVAWCRTFSGPRRSNFPKSSVPCTIERPEPLDWSMTITIMIIPVRRINVLRIDIYKKIIENYKEKESIENSNES